MVVGMLTPFLMPKTKSIASEIVALVQWSSTLMEHLDCVRVRQIFVHYFLLIIIRINKVDTAAVVNVFLVLSVIFTKKDITV